MTSATSLYKKEIIKQVIRNVGWLSLLYLLGLLFSLPLRLFMQYSRDNLYYYTNYNYLFSGEFAVQFFFLITIPILMGVFVFRYLHVKQSADFFHSLPIKRRQLFHQHLIIGLLMLIIPIIVTAIVLQVVYMAIGLQEYFAATEIYTWLCITLLFTIMLYMVSVFIGMLTALSVMQAVLTFIFIIFPTGISALLLFNLNNFLVGFPVDYYGRIGIEKLSPMIRLESLSRDPFSIMEIVIYMIVIVACYVASLLIYKMRRIESVSQAIAFTQLKPVFKYGVTACTMLLSGVYFGETMDSKGWLFFGYVVGSILGYFVAEMILEKSWRVFQNIKGYLIYAAFVVVILAFVQFDVFQYSSKLPKYEEIERVYMTDEPYLIYHKDMVDDREIVPFEKDDTIEKVYEFHQQLIEAKPNGQEYATRQMLIMYELSDGKKFVREYRVPFTEQYATYLAPIMETEEYKRTKYAMLSVDAQRVDRLTFRPSWMNYSNREVIITDPMEIEEAIEAVKQDISQLTYEQMIDSRISWSHIQILQNDDSRLHFEWGHGYPNVARWLQEHGYYEDAILQADDIRYITVANREGFNLTSFSHEEMRSRIESSPNTLRLEEQENIEQVLYNATGHLQNGDYVLAIVYENNFTDFLSIQKEHVPVFILNHFQ